MSTNRYLNAGAPGTGTTVDNMASRVKAWAHVNQTGTQAIKDSYNVSSITDNGVGRTAYNYASVFSTANKSEFASCENPGFFQVPYLVATATASDINVLNASSAAFDTSFLHLAVVGTLA